MNIGELVATLGVDIRDLKKGILQAESNLREYTKTTDKELDKGQFRWAKYTAFVTKKNQGLAGSFKGLATAIGGMYLAYKGIDIVKEIVQTGVRIESITNAFKAVTGSTKSARKELEFVSQTAYNLGLNIRALEDSFKTLAAASMKTKLEGAGARDVFYAVAEASAAMQLSATQTHASLYALQQMMSKGRVQTEELRRQLGEQLPGAFQMAAEAMDMTTFELNKMLELGKVVSEDFLPKFAKVLHERFGAAAVFNAELARGAFNRFGNEVEMLKRSIASAGLTEFFADLARTTTRVMSGLRIEILDNGKDIQEYFKKISDAFQITLKQINVTSVVNELEVAANSLKTIGSVVVSLVNTYKAMPDALKGGIIVGIIGTASPIMGVAAGLGLLSRSVIDFKDGLVALSEGGITFDQFMGKDDGSFEKALNHWRDLKALTDGNITTLQEMKAKVEVLRKSFNVKISSPFSKYSEEQQEQLKELEMLQVEIAKYNKLIDAKETNIALGETAKRYLDIGAAVSIIERKYKDLMDIDIFQIESAKQGHIVIQNVVKEIQDYEKGIRKGDSTIEEAVKTSKKWVKELKDQKDHIYNVSKALMDADFQINAFEGGTSKGQVDEKIKNAADETQRMITAMESLKNIQISNSLQGFFSGIEDEELAIKENETPGIIAMETQTKFLKEELIKRRKMLHDLAGDENEIGEEGLLRSKQIYEEQAADFKKVHEQQFKDMQKMNKLIGNEEYLLANSMKDSSLETIAAMEHAFDGWANTYISNLNEMLWESELTFNGILKSFGKMVTQMMLMESLSPMVKTMSSGFGSLFGGLFGAANGAIFKGGINVQKFAGGATNISSPTLGLVGEGRYNEAIVPLPDGKSIPVQMAGGASSVEVHIHNAPPVKNKTQSRGQGGGERIDIWLETQMAGVAAGQNSFTNTFEKKYNLRPALSGR